MQLGGYAKPHHGAGIHRRHAVMKMRLYRIATGLMMP